MGDWKEAKEIGIDYAGYTWRSLRCMGFNNLSGR